MSELVSVIIPVYNVEKYLEKCMHSILNQTYKNLEIILVNDGSIDTSGEMCDKYAQKDNRVRVIHKENGGASSARNRGLKEIDGDFVVFVDADDWVEIDMIESLYEVIIKYNADMVMAQECSTRGNKSASLEVWDKKRYLEHFFRTRGEADTHNVWAKIYKKTIFENFSFIEGRMNEDILATYEFANKCNKVIYTNKSVYHYQKNVEGVTNSEFTEKKLDLLFVWEVVRKHVEEENIEFLEVCKMNQLRAHFTLLSQMKLNRYDKKNKILVQKKKELKSVVRKGYWKLMRWKMPISRKILLTILMITG